MGEPRFPDVARSRTDGMGYAACGNANHPLGAWHPLRPMPFQFILWERDTWTRAARRERKSYNANVAKWGCGCDA